MTAGAAGGMVDFTATLAELRNQELNGHTAETDREQSLDVFADKTHRLAAELADVMRHGARQNLEVAYRRAARLTAFGLSVQQRIRHEQKRSTDQ